MSTGPDAPIDVRRSLEAARDALAAGRLREVFRAALVAVALVRGRDRTLIYANPAFAALFPVTARVGEGTAVGALGLPGLAVAVEQVLLGGIAVRAEEQRTGGAEERLATLTVSPVPGVDEAEPGDVLVVGLDVTGQALDRREVQRSADENRWVESATAALQSETDPAEELVALARALVPAFADACSAILLDRPVDPSEHRPGAELRGRRVASVGGDGETGPPAGDDEVVWTPSAAVLHDAVRTDRPVVQALDAGDPAAGAWFDELRRSGATSVAAVPVRDGAATVGLLTFSTVDRPPFSRADLAVMGRLAARAGNAVSQGLRLARERDTSLTLQRSMLTRAPVVPGLEVATRYRPSVADAEVGGDWYDAFARPDGDLMVVIGDVAGHDLAAAATMGQLRSMLRALAVDRDAPPAELLARLDAAATSLHVTDFTTLVLGRLRVGAESGEPVSLQWASAGHPPPLLLPSTGSPRLLEAGGGLVLGVRPDAPRTTATTTLQPDDTLVLYTDGLVERRGPNPDANVITLVAQAAAAAWTPYGVSLPDLCDELVSRAPVDDDVAVLAVRAR